MNGKIVLGVALIVGIVGGYFLGNKMQEKKNKEKFDVKPK